jgi:hypothetical protein
LLDRSLDRFQHAIDIFEHVMIPEPDDPIASAGEKCRAAIVCRAVCMLSTVKLDGQSELVAGEVAEEGTDRCLPAKVVRFERGLAEVLPQLVLDIRRVASQLASAADAPVDRARVLLHQPFSLQSGAENGGSLLESPTAIEQASPPTHSRCEASAFFLPRDGSLKAAYAPPRHPASLALRRAGGGEKNASILSMQLPPRIALRSIRATLRYDPGLRHT